MNNYLKLDYKAIGDRIRYLRGDESQSEFGKKFNRSYLDIGRIERGEVKPTAELLFNICRKYNVEIEWLLTGKGKMKKEKDTDPREFFSSEAQSIKDMGSDILFRPEEERIGSILVRKGFINGKDLQVALMEQSKLPVEYDQELFEIVNLLSHEYPDVKKVILMILKYRREIRDGINSLLSLDNLSRDEAG